VYEKIGSGIVDTLLNNNFETECKWSRLLLGKFRWGRNVSYTFVSHTCL